VTCQAPALAPIGPLLLFECNPHFIIELWRLYLAQSGAQDAVTLSVVDFPAPPDLDLTKGLFK
jgi:hypothetical protein